MLTLLFGVDVRISGWATALLLAIVLTLFFRRTRFYRFIQQAKEAATESRFCKLRIRWAMQFTVVAVITLALGLLLNQEPVPNSGLAGLYRLNHHDYWQGNHRLILDDLEVTIIVLSLLLFTTAANRLDASLHRRIEAWGQYHFRTIRIQKLSLVTRAQIASVLIQLVNATRYVLSVLVVSAGILIILSLYPLTSGLSRAVADWVSGIVASAWADVQAFLPNLLMLILIAVATRLALKTMGFFYDAFWKGKIWVNTLHPELVEPTYQLLRMLVIAFALVAAFPYIPGSDSPVFRAISIFGGFLLSLGSTSLASNIVSGIVLTYTRGLRIGDRVQVADCVGDVIDRTLLVTRIRTIKNVVITLPNSKVMQNEVNNYSADAEKNGLILHTTVTIGYDVPWRTIDRLLIQAALNTPDILEDPAPFVLKTNLDNYYISYELNAYTDQANKMVDTYSALHENILDEFNQAEVEIMSPAYMSLRDGEPTTIPQEKDRSAGNGATESETAGRPRTAR